MVLFGHEVFECIDMNWRVYPVIHVLSPVLEISVDHAILWFLICIYTMAAR